MCAIAMWTSFIFKYDPGKLAKQIVIVASSVARRVCVAVSEPCKSIWNHSKFDIFINLSVVNLLDIFEVYHCNFETLCMSTSPEIVIQK